jgi:hypothetical protein
MQRKQQVGECWVCVIFFACVCVWVRQIRQLRLTIPSPRALPLQWALPRGVPGGGRYAPPWLRAAYGATARNFFLGGFCYF